jgi:hypothetical protein
MLAMSVPSLLIAPGLLRTRAPSCPAASTSSAHALRFDAITIHSNSPGSSTRVPRSPPNATVRAPRVSALAPMLAAATRSSNRHVSFPVLFSCLSPAAGRLETVLVR